MKKHGESEHGRKPFNFKRRRMLDVHGGIKRFFPGERAQLSMSSESEMRFEWAK